MNRKFLLFFTLLFAALTITVSFGHSVAAKAAEEKTGVGLACLLYTSVDSRIVAYKSVRLQKNNTIGRQ